MTVCGGASSQIHSWRGLATNYSPCPNCEESATKPGTNLADETPQSFVVMALGLRASILGAVLIALAVGCAPDPPSGAVGVVASGCANVDANGSGVIVAPGLVLTSAHVVKGAEHVTVIAGHQTTTGRVVAFDPEMDLAYLEVAPSLGKPVRLDTSTPADQLVGRTGVAYVFRDGQIETIPVRITNDILIRTEDIYVEGQTQRFGFELDADIQSGDSGGAIVVDGRVVGVLWATSRAVDQRAYGINSNDSGQLVRNQLNTGRIDDEIDVTRCD
jgi:S1-C subfamily serine protease